jgi:hypothetical protein
MPPKRPVSEQIDSPSRPATDPSLFDDTALFNAVIGEFASVAPRLKPGELVSWVSNRRITHEPAFRRMFFGTIEWARADGRPTTPTLSAAFSIVHAWPDAFTESAGEDLTVPLVIETPYAIQPSLVDGPSDEQTLRVSYCGVIGTHPIEHPVQQVRIRGTEGTTWRTPDGRPIKSVRPQPLLWSLTSTGPVRFLPPFLLTLA